MPFRAQLLQSTYLGATTTSSSDEVSTLAKLMAEYGTEVVIIAVFLILIGLFAFAIIRILNKLVETLIKQNQQILNKISGVEDDKPDEKKTDEKKKKDESKKEEKKDSPKEKEEPKLGLVANNIYINKIFNEVSKKIIADLKCDRIGIYVFHNGNKTPYGYSFVKMSCIYEQTLRGTTTNRGINHQGLPLHVFTNIIDCLMRNGEYIIGNVYNHGIISADEQILNFINGSRTKALFAISVKDDNKEVAGFIIAEFDNEQDFSNNDNYTKARNSLRTMSDTIRPIIIDDEFRARYENNKEAH